MQMRTISRSWCWTARSRYWYFWATWCGPCQMLAPALEELSQQVKVVKVDVDENPQLAMAFQVSSIPTVVSFRDGKALKKSVGVVPGEKLLELLK